MNKPTNFLITTAFIISACGEAEHSNRVVGELASDRIELTAESNEPITAIRFAEGDSVETGQVLVEQDSTRAAACPRAAG
jgi:multidrug efflux pump subunit AcrA (membrane-fusion protein)